MKFFNWMQNKFHKEKGNTKSNASSNSYNTIPESTKEEFSDSWPHGLLTIGTFGNNVLKENPESQEVQVDALPQDLAEFTPEEVGKLEKELSKLLSRKPASKVEREIANLPLDRFLNCPSSLEIDRIISNYTLLSSDISNDRDEEEEEDIDQTIKMIIGRCRDACIESNKKSIRNKSISFLLKKMFVCRSEFAPAPSLRDTFQDSRVEKLLRTVLSKKIYTQNSSQASSMKNYIEDIQMPKIGKQDEREEKSNEHGSKWDKTDFEYIVLEI